MHATADAAWASFLEGAVGVLRPGLLADVILLDRDPFALDLVSLLDTKVVETVVAGVTVYADAARGSSGAEQSSR